MIKKLLYTVVTLFELSHRLKNPFVIFEYLYKKFVYLRFKDGLILKTNQILDAIIIKETIIDDDYKISSLKRPLKTIIDGGAGLGDFSLLVARKFPKAKIFAFEPNPQQFKLLETNIKLNRIKNIRCYSIAIGTKKSYDLFLSNFNVHASTQNNLRAKTHIKVVGKRLDRFIQNPIDLLKIDCEGAEVDILQSISKNKMELIKKIIIEYHNHIIQNEDKKILTILGNWPYRIIFKKNTLIPETGYIFATLVRKHQ